MALLSEESPKVVANQLKSAIEAAKVRLAEIAKERAALDAEEASLKAMLGEKRRHRRSKQDIVNEKAAKVRDERRTG